jgi:myo-inositol-1(or 4)-monophosphatase
MPQFSSFITTQLQQVAEMAVQQFGKVSGTTKTGDNNQVLTQTDLEVGQALITAVTASYPDHNIIDEEAGVIDKKSAYTWVIDPIDGTSNFANGVPTYGIMIGLLHESTPIAGGIALPAFNQILVAEKGEGTTANGQKVTVTSEDQLLKTLVAYGIDGHQEDPALTQKECQVLAEIVLKIRNLRSSNSAFDIAQVALGRYGAMLNQTSKIWDNVAQHIIIEEAGGLYTDFWGQPIGYDQPLTRAEQNFTFCAANPALHAQLQAAIHS